MNSAWLTSYRAGASGNRPSRSPVRPTRPAAPIWLVPKGQPSRAPVTNFANENFRPSTKGGLRLPGGLLRKLPYVGIALLAYDLWEWYNFESTDLDLGPWNVGGTCANPGSPWGGKPDMGRSASDNSSPDVHPWHNNADNCLTGQVAGSQEWSAFVPSRFHEVIIRQRWHSDIRTRIIESYWRPPDSSIQPHAPEEVVVSATRVLPEGYPELVPGFPELIPIGVPTQLPAQPIPWTQVGSIPESQFHTTSYGPGIEPVAPPRFHPGPPGPGVRERKVRSPGATQIMWALNFVTESIDLGQALWEALPPEFQTPNATPNERVADLWNNWRYIDVGQALENIIENAIEDFLIGRASQLANTNQLNFREVRIGNLVGPAI